MRFSRAANLAGILGAIFLSCAGCTTETPDEPMTSAPVSSSSASTAKEDDQAALATATNAESSHDAPAPVAPDANGAGADYAYKAVEGISGRVNSVGSDTMNNLMTLWLEGFKRNYPNIEFEIEGKGSATAPAALIAGAATFGPMSRAMKDKETSDFAAKFGYKPTELPSCIDMLAVYVNKDNPIKGLSMQQVDAIFSASRKGGGTKDIKTWGDLGLTGEWADKPINLFGRNAASGTYGFFKEKALFGGDFKNEVKESPGSSAVVQGVASNRYAIGYSGMGYKTADVKFVPLSQEEGGEFVDVVPENAYSGAYPLARYLYVYLNHKPNSDLVPLRREFIRYIYSREGQAVVTQDGYLPVGPDMTREALATVGIDAGT